VQSPAPAPDQRASRQSSHASPLLFHDQTITIALAAGPPIFSAVHRRGTVERRQFGSTFAKNLIRNLSAELGAWRSISPPDTKPRQLGFSLISRSARVTLSDRDRSPDDIRQLCTDFFFATQPAAKKSAYHLSLRRPVPRIDFASTGPMVSTHFPIVRPD
jgi:hypothetical protein